MPRAISLFKRRAILLGTVAIVALGGAGLTVHSLSSVQAQPQAAAPAPAIPVTVRTVAPEKVRVWSEFSGRLQAVDFAQVRPEVSGRITEVRFKDGQAVKAGDVLFVIDPRPYEAAVAKAEANLASAQTNARFAKAEVDRAASLIKTQAIAERLYDERVNASKVAQASIQAAEAALKEARLDLDYAYVKAPIGGRASRAEITVGNLVQAGPNAPLLTSVVSNDGIYADFEVDEHTYLRSVRANADTQEEEQQIAVELTVSGDSEKVYKGMIHTFDNRIDAASGTIRARAKFANEDRSLLPGMFASIRLAGAGDATAILVPSRAIGSNQNKRFVYVVSEDSKVTYREVTLGQQVSGQRIVQSGLQQGDRVIVDGLQHVRPDATVQVSEAGEGKTLAANNR
jgi:multidrug efflux system membrane fusion protein